MKTMSLKEFQQAGYLQELNRQFLHPLGLALNLYVNSESGEIEFGGIWDNRDDPGGIVFAGIVQSDRYKAAWIDREKRHRMNARIGGPAGAWVQAMPNPDGCSECWHKHQGSYDCHWQEIAREQSAEVFSVDMDSTPWIDAVEIITCDCRAEQN